MTKRSVNYSRYISGQRNGHYESFFLRANHPKLPLAFWIRYTIFSPVAHPEKAIGELWAIYFDGTKHRHFTIKKELPISDCIFSNDKFFVQIGDAVLQSDSLNGSATSGKNNISWNLNYSGKEKPLLALPENLYEGSFPKAKLLVGLPLAKFNGAIKVNEEEINITDWVGSQNHNWGPKHTDNYAWGQVAGFDNSPDSFFELSTARLKFGPVWTPFFTLMVLRHQGEEYRLNTIFQALKAKGNFNYFTWQFHSKNADAEIKGEIKATLPDFAGLTYYNPPGGVKYCLNTKIASCKIEFTDCKKNTVELLETANRAAFEILTDDRTPGVKIDV